MKGNKGITLIALVITIIVLLILAGVSIAMLSGDNSILGNASKSADYNKIGEVKDQIALKVSEYTSEFYQVKYNGATWSLGGDAPTTAEGATLAAIATFHGTTDNGCTVAYTAPDGTTDPATEGYIDITSGSYYVTGEITSTGNVTWGDITKGTAPDRS